MKYNNSSNAMKLNTGSGKKSQCGQMSIFDLINIANDSQKARLEYEANKKKREAEKARQEQEKVLDSEHIREVTSMELPMDWENFYSGDDAVCDVHVESISDGLVKSLNNKGCVDIEYIASISHTDCKLVIERLKGAIFQDPNVWNECFYKGWVMAEEYLSGNVIEKLLAAETANKRYNGYFKANVKALKDVLPPTVSAKDIYITLGSPWIPTSVIEDFIYHLFGATRATVPPWRAINIKHDEETGTWEYERNYDHIVPYDFNQKYGTKKRRALEILLRTLNMQSMAVYDSIDSEHTKSGKKNVINKDETVLAIDKQKLFIEEFKNWVWTNPSRRKQLEQIYKEKYGSVRQRHFDGSFLEFPGMNPEVELFKYQRDAIARIIFSPNTLLAHDVGSGKTYIMIAAGMELKRMGLSTKNLYVVPNNIIGQWRSIFYSLYPDASIRCIEPKNFKPEKRESVLRDIKNNDYDAVIMAYSCFTQIPVSVRYQVNELQKVRRELEELAANKNKKTKKLLSRIDKLKEKAFELTMTIGDEGICFDELGITRLFIDEAHNFKNVPVDTKVERVMGISKSGSSKCQDLMEKVRIVQHQNGGKGVILATGTPITNSITDAFIMQQYLQSGELSLLDLQSFDSWIGMFAEQSSNFEIDVDTSNYRMATRFAQFHNIPELTTMLAAVADFHRMDESQGVPEHDGYCDVLIRKTRDFADYLKLISRRADDVRMGRVSRADDNMLKITTDGRKAALDLRLIDEEYPFTTSSKVFACAERVAQIYMDTMANHSTQLVFCDSSTPKDGFNIYDELKSLLERMGVNADEVAFIHDASTETKREKIFADVRAGRIRVLIGSTFKLGLGVNVQDKLIAIHHLDVPWRPADMVQREGRILRQGNENEKVEIYRYITEGSFDAYSWQLLETKQRFISDLLSGTAEDRSGADVDDTVLNYAEVKALAVGNPLIKERVETANELSRYMILQQKVVAQHLMYEKELDEIPDKIARLKEIMPSLKADLDYYTENKREYTLEERKELRQLIFSASHPDEITKEEVVAATYQGFNVVVPENVSATYPIVYMCREGRYMVELGFSEIGGMTRIDNFLEGLQKRYDEMVNKLHELKAQKSFIRAELDKDINYYDDIQRCREDLARIDEELGVGKDE